MGTGRTKSVCCRTNLDLTAGIKWEVKSSLIIAPMTSSSAAEALLQHVWIVPRPRPSGRAQTVEDESELKLKRPAKRASLLTPCPALERVECHASHRLADITCVKVRADISASLPLPNNAGKDVVKENGVPGNWPRAHVCSGHSAHHEGG